MSFFRNKQNGRRSGENLSMEVAWVAYGSLRLKKDKNYIKFIKKRDFSTLSEKLFVLLHAYCSAKEGNLLCTTYNIALQKQQNDG